MGAEMQYTVSLQDSNKGASRTYIIKEHNGDRLLRTFMAVVFANSSDESEVARWCETNPEVLPVDGGTVRGARWSGMNQDVLPVDDGMIFVELHNGFKPPPL